MKTNQKEIVNGKLISFEAYPESFLRANGRGWQKIKREGGQTN